jgi:hypothetical protein
LNCILLKAPTRLEYPKIAQKSTLDSLLERQEKLRDEKLRELAEGEAKTEEIAENVIPLDIATNAKKYNHLQHKYPVHSENSKNSKNKVQKKLVSPEVIQNILKIHQLRSQLKYIH